MLNEYKQIGWIVMNPQRYIINFVINNYEETVNVIDMRKQKIGEAKVTLFVDMFKNEEFYPNPTQPEIKKPPVVV